MDTATYRAAHLAIRCLRREQRLDLAEMLTDAAADITGERDDWSALAFLRRGPGEPEERATIVLTAITAIREG